MQKQTSVDLPFNYNVLPCLPPLCFCSETEWFGGFRTNSNCACRHLFNMGRSSNSCLLIEPHSDSAACFDPETEWCLWYCCWSDLNPLETAFLLGFLSGISAWVLLNIKKLRGNSVRGEKSVLVGSGQQFKRCVTVKVNLHLV